MLYMPPTELVSVRRTVSMTSWRMSSQKTHRMTITPEDGGVPIVVPYAPRNVDHTGRGGSYLDIPRPGLPSVIVYDGERLPRMSFTLIVVDKELAGHDQSVTAISVLEALENLAKTGKRVRVSYAKMESGLWYIEDFSFQSVMRHPATDEITHATVDITFVRASEVVIGVGPVTGGVKPPAPPPAPKPAAKTSATYHTMKKGDTLWDLSIKYYGTGTKWRIIADANGIKNVRAIPVGKKIRIP